MNLGQCLLRYRRRFSRNIEHPSSQAMVVGAKRTKQSNIRYNSNSASRTRIGRREARGRVGLRVQEEEHVRDGQGETGARSGRLCEPCRVARAADANSNNENNNVAIVSKSPEGRKAMQDLSLSEDEEDDKQERLVVIPAVVVVVVVGRE